MAWAEIAQECPLASTLGEAREKAQLSISEIAEKTKVSSHYLSAIEHGELEKLPSRIHALGFVQAFANAVEVDGASVRAELREWLYRD